MDIQEFARLGGQASAKKRLKNLTKKQISKIMKRVRGGESVKTKKND